jgi:hypothetical protein
MVLRDADQKGRAHSRWVSQAIAAPLNLETADLRRIQVGGRASHH